MGVVLGVCVVFTWEVFLGVCVSLVCIIYGCWAWGVILVFGEFGFGFGVG